LLICSVSEIAPRLRGRIVGAKLRVGRRLAVRGWKLSAVTGASGIQIIKIHCRNNELISDGYLLQGAREEANRRRREVRDIFATTAA
jgi:hypothetical protein